MYAGNHDDYVQQEMRSYQESHEMTEQEYEAGQDAAERGEAQAMDEAAREAARDFDLELAEANASYEAWLLELPRHEPSGRWCEDESMLPAPF
jgi:hypothetical protein